MACIVGTILREWKKVLYSWKSAEHIKFSQQWSTFRVRRQVRVLAHDLGHMIRHKHCPQLLITHKPRETVVFCGWSADWRHSLQHLHIFYPVVFTYTSDGWYASLCGSTKTCWWSFLWSKWQLTNVSSSSSVSLVSTVGKTSSNLFALSVLQMHLHHSCNLHQATKSFLSTGQIYSVIQVIR